MEHEQDMVYIIRALERLMQADHEFKASQGYIAKTCLKKKKKRRR
jgi:hypothetical protein